MSNSDTTRRRTHVHGKFLRLGAERFLIKGVSYGTFAPGAGGYQFPPLERVSHDFAMMARTGLNTVRAYTPPSAALLDEALRCGLRVMVGLPWTQHVAFLDDRRLCGEIRRQIAADVRVLSHHPAVLLFALGNEIPPAVIRWHGRARVERFLRDLYDEAKAISPDSLFTYVNYPPTEYLELSYFDVCAFNVYLHRERELRAYLARLQHVAGHKPLLLSEAGADSIREGQEGQAAIVSTHIRAAHAEGACGTIVFTWTDEWWRGGRDVEDWAFGLVDRGRTPKAALHSVEQAMATAPFDPQERRIWPSVSVVVCAYNAADTLEDCLQSLGRLTYPHVEVILVDDGSSDQTAAIARPYPFVKVIQTSQGGLSRARNVGLAQATGEIVAYTDADVRVDPEWLTYLVQPFLTSDAVGAGGPNMVPPDDPWMAQCVARAPGGPTHVMHDDRIAEHIPGCNMAFRRDALLAIGGFNPIYLRAGDDVDICWRLQARGWTLGFAPSALVWHHHRSSLRAYWRQQVGYGEGEAWLKHHHPDKFIDSQIDWRGRIYSPLPFIHSLSRARISTGVWGSALFPSIYHFSAHPLALLPQSILWQMTSLGLTIAGAAALATRRPDAGMLFLSLGMLGLAATILKCVMCGIRSDLVGVPPVDGFSPQTSRVLTRAMIAWLHVVQPLARACGRVRGMMVPPASTKLAAQKESAGSWHPGLRGILHACLMLTGKGYALQFWGERWRSKDALLTSIIDQLRAARAATCIDIDDGWNHDADISLGIGSCTRLKLRALVEDHDSGRCLFRVGLRLRPVAACGASIAALAGVLLWTGSAVAGVPMTSLFAAAVVVGAVMTAQTVWSTSQALAGVRQAIERVAADAGLSRIARPKSERRAVGTVDRRRSTRAPALAELSHSDNENAQLRTLAESAMRTREALGSPTLAHAEQREQL